MPRLYPSPCSVCVGAQHLPAPHVSGTTALLVAAMVLGTAPKVAHTKKRGFRWKALGTATPTHALAVVCCNSRSPLRIFLFPCGKGGLSSKDWKMPISCSVVYALHFLGKDTVISHDGWTGNTEEKIIQIERFSLKSQVNKCCKQMQRFKEQIRRE